MHEITFSTIDRPKLLSQVTMMLKSFLLYLKGVRCSSVTELKMVNLQLTSLLAEVGLNIQEAHAFSTVDGYSLDVFVVDGWPFEVPRLLKNFNSALISNQALPKYTQSFKMFDYRLFL